MDDFSAVAVIAAATAAAAVWLFALRAHFLQFVSKLNDCVILLDIAVCGFIFQFVTASGHVYFTQWDMAFW